MCFLVPVFEHRVGEGLERGFDDWGFKDRGTLGFFRGLAPLRQGRLAFGILGRDLPFDAGQLAQSGRERAAILETPIVKAAFEAFPDAVLENWNKESLA